MLLEVSFDEMPVKELHGITQCTVVIARTTATNEVIAQRRPAAGDSDPLHTGGVQNLKPNLKYCRQFVAKNNVLAFVTAT